MRKEDLKFIVNMLVMLCNNDRTHFLGLVNVLQNMFLYCQCYKCISKLYPRYSTRTRYPTSNFPIYLPSMVLFSCKSCITKFPSNTYLLIYISKAGASKIHQGKCPDAAQIYDSFSKSYPDHKYPKPFSFGG